MSRHGGGWELSVSIQLRTGHILRLLLIKVAILLVTCHDVQVVKVRVVIHRAVGKKAVRLTGGLGQGNQPPGYACLHCLES